MELVEERESCKKEKEALSSGNEEQKKEIKELKEEIEKLENPGKV